jgi:LysR family hydrogen peroxide-inducible transcriptional activator
MDLRQLAALTAVADHHSFSAAARALHTVQSNVSTHVARLERELGAPLVDRSTGHLTEAGTLVVERARRIHAELDALVSDVASSLGEISGQVRLGMIGTTGRWLVPRLLRALEQAHPRVRLVVVDATTTSLLPQLAAGTLDFAVVNLPAIHPDIETEVLFEEEHVVLVAEDHPLTRRDAVELTDLADLPLLLEPPGTGFRDDLDGDAARVGVTLVPQAEIDGMRLLASLASQGFGAAILPASAVVERPDEPWRTVSLHGTTPRAVGLAFPRRARLAAPARAALDVLRGIVQTEVPARAGLHLPAGHAVTGGTDGPVPSTPDARPEDHR